MSLLGDSQTLVEIAELESRKVTVALHDEDSEEGVLHAISEHGVLIKSEEKSSYLLFPWKMIKWVEHTIKSKKSTEESTEGQSQEETEEVDTIEQDPIMRRVGKDKIRLLSMMQVAKETLDDSDYAFETDGEDINIRYDDEECATITREEIKVQDSDYVGEMKEIAKELNLKVIREYEE